VAVARKIYGGATGADGAPFYPMGYAKGSERAWIAGLVGVDGKSPSRAGSARFLLDRLIGPTATLADFDYARHGLTGGPIGGLLDYGPDGRRLAAFKDRGGKILLYHGWSDTDATPASSLEFHAAQAKAFGADALPEFLRLFMLPGMAHCRGGNGVNTVDYLSAMEAWIERGQAPDRLIAFKTTLPPDSYSAFPLPPEAIVSGRPVFPYPAVAVFGGAGDPNDAASWRAK
jgi:feruloyl esterase